MTRVGITIGESSQRLTGVKRGREEGMKYTRYTEEQIEVLEKVYAQCPNPNRFQRAQITSEHPILKDVDNKQLKIWFQNRRCREKQKKENSELVTENKKLNDVNKDLRVETDRLHKTVAQLQSENEFMRNKCRCLATMGPDLGRLPKVNTSDVPVRVDVDNNRLISLAEEAKNEFIAKVFGTVIHWIFVSILKLPSWISISDVFVSSACEGVAAKAYTLVPFDPIKTIEILKDRPSWSRDCRNMNVYDKHATENGGTIELVYTQCYAPTTMACARDFLTVRYTSLLDDGTFIVCEKSISDSEAISSSPAALEFVRAKILTSGYMIRPCEGGSTIQFVEHLDLEASSVHDVVRPLYESPALLAKKNIVHALQYIDHLAKEEKKEKKAPPYYEGPPPRTYGQKLSRGFNDATNGFTKDGWTLMNVDASDDVILSVKKITDGLDPKFNNVICVKASLIILNVSPAKLVKLLKERRPDWLNVNFADQSPGLAQATGFAFPGSDTHNLSDFPVGFGKTSYEDEILEVTRFDRLTNHRLCNSSGDIYHVQITNGMEETDFGACSEFIFAPFHRRLPNDTRLLSSGFRIFFLGSNTGASSSANAATVSQPRSLLNMAFQFPFESHFQDEVVTMAKKFIQHVIYSVKKYCSELMPTEPTPVVKSTEGPSELIPAMNSTEANPTTELNMDPNLAYFINLAHLICQSYSSRLGADLLGYNYQTPNPESVLDFIQLHQYAILCFSFTTLPICVYSNLAGLNMFETTADNLHSITVDRVLDASNNLSLDVVLPTILQQGFAILSPGYCLSLMNRCVSYEQAVLWFVQGPDDSSVHCLALAFIDWSFY